MITYFIGCIFYYISNELASNFIKESMPDASINTSSLRLLNTNPNITKI